VALDWLPIYPDMVPHHRQKITGGSPALFTVKTNPPPDILAGLTFLPDYPDQVPHRRSIVTQASPMDFSAALIPTSWRPTYPDQVPHRYSVNVGGLTEPPPGAGILIAQSMAWQARFPDKVPHRRYHEAGGEVFLTEPAIIAAGEPCVELIDTAFTVPTFIDATVTISTLVDAEFTTPTLTDGEFC
jgi:hypothetical protein